MKKTIFILLLFCWGTAFSQVRLSEYQTNNYNTLFLNGKSPDWAELVNEGTSAVNLKGYCLTDEEDDGEPAKFYFEELVLQPQERLLVHFTGRERKSIPIEVGFKLRDGDVVLLLQDPDGNTLDLFELPCVPEGKSAGRNEKDSLVIFNVPTPGEANQNMDLFSVELYHDTVIVSKPTGLYTSAIAVELTTSNKNTAVRYTLDGDEVNIRQQEYSSTLQLENKRNAKDRIADEPTSHLWKEPKTKVFKAQVLRAQG